MMNVTGEIPCSEFLEEPSDQKELEHAAAIGVFNEDNKLLSAILRSGLLKPRLHCPLIRSRYSVDCSACPLFFDPRGRVISAVIDPNGSVTLYIRADTGNVLKRVYKIDRFLKLVRDVGEKADEQRVRELETIMFLINPERIADVSPEEAWEFFQFVNSNLVYASDYEAITDTLFSSLLQGIDEVVPETAIEQRKVVPNYVLVRRKDGLKLWISGDRVSAVMGTYGREQVKTALSMMSAEYAKLGRKPFENHRGYDVPVQALPRDVRSLIENMLEEVIE